MPRLIHEGIGASQSQLDDRMNSAQRQISELTRQQAEQSAKILLLEQTIKEANERLQLFEQVVNKGNEQHAPKNVFVQNETKRLGDNEMSGTPFEKQYYCCERIEEMQREIDKLRERLLKEFNVREHTCSFGAGWTALSPRPYNYMHELEEKCKKQEKELEVKQKEIDKIQGTLCGYGALQRPFKYVIDLEEKNKRQARKLETKECEIQALANAARRDDVKMKTLEWERDELRKSVSRMADELVPGECIASSSCNPCPFDMEKVARDGIPGCYVSPKAHITTLRKEVAGLKEQVRFQIELREKVGEQLKEVSVRLLDAEKERDKVIELGEPLMVSHLAQYHRLAHAARQAKSEIKRLIKEGDKVGDQSEAMKAPELESEDVLFDEPPLTEEEETGVKPDTDCC